MPVPRFTDHSFPGASSSFCEVLWPPWFLSAMVSLALPDRYTATTNILPPQQSQSLAASMIGQLNALGPMAAMAQKDLGLKNPTDLYIGMLRSRTSEDALVHRFDLLHVYRDNKISDARQDLEKQAVSCSVRRASSASRSKIKIAAGRLRSRTPESNSYASKEHRNWLSPKLASGAYFFERQLELARNNLGDAEQALKATEQKTGLIELDGQAKVIIESVVRLRALIAAKEVELHAHALVFD